MLEGWPELPVHIDRRLHEPLRFGLVCSIGLVVRCFGPIGYGENDLR
jgi:hypothetical protein